VQQPRRPTFAQRGGDPSRLDGLPPNSTWRRASAAGASRANLIEERRGEEHRRDAVAVQRLGESAQRKHRVARDTAIRDPLSSDPQISKVAASNAGFERCATVSAADSRTIVGPAREARDGASAGSHTLGIPVDPDVYIT
jgi:hypothetical protein